MPRTLLNLGDIAAVPRRSPSRPKKRTPWRPQPEGTSTFRAGEREWFGDRVFADAQEGHGKSGFLASVSVHAVVATAVLAFLITRPIRAVVVRMDSMKMPAFVAQQPIVPPVGASASANVASPTSRVSAATPAPPPPPARGTAVPPAPIEAPPDIVPETGAEAPVAGVESGVAGGVDGGTVGGVLGGVVGGEPNGSGSSSARRSGPEVVRAGVDLKPPRKIRDVKPVYPTGALPLRAQGAVLIEAVIGPDGHVQDARVLHSVLELLDRAALDAVRQWVYEPSVFRGQPVAVVMTVVVNFALQ